MRAKFHKSCQNKGTYQGFNRSILNRVNLICEKVIKKTDYVVDATCGNGFDTLRLALLSKKVFAQGAIKAAKYIVNKKNGLYSMDDLINNN